MKINEIIINEGFLDKLKQVGGAVAGGVQSAVRSGQIRQIADMSSKTWIKMLGKIEAQKNDYQAMQGNSLAPYLQNWIDQTLLGSLSLKSASPEIKTAVSQAVQQITAQPRNRNMAADAFEKILQLSIAGSSAPDITTMSQAEQDKALAAKVRDTLKNNPQSLSQDDLNDLKALAGV